MKIYKYIGITMLAATMLTVASCSEFDDYNKAVADIKLEGNQTLWENISQESQLSDFADLVRRSGLDSALNAIHYYTVWAPLNGTFDPAPFQTMSDAALMRQFVKNHIASYAHHASGKLDDRVLMLNDKTYGFIGDGAYLFDGVELDQTNLPNSNGVLHTLKGVATYYPNLYEFVTDSVQSQGMGIDSLRKYFQRYETTYLDESRSVVGPIVNGMQTYVDSVMVTENTLWYSLNVKMENEDSTYTFLMPTNKAWNATYQKLKNSFNYISGTVAKTFTGNEKSTDVTQQDPLPLDVEYWKDSIANRYLTRYLAYSNTNAYNKWLTGNPTSLGSDTLYSTTRDKLSNPRDILAQTVQQVKMSNGTAYIVDSLAIQPWETYSPEFELSATNKRVLGQYLASTANTVEVQYPDHSIVDLSKQNSATYKYLWLEPSSNRSKPEASFYLRNVLSTAYDIYCIIVPEKVDTRKADAVTQPNLLNFTLTYCDTDGKLKDQLFLYDRTDDEINDIFSSMNYKDGKIGSTNYNVCRGFINDTSKVDTMYVGEFTFPVCYYGLGDNYCPILNVSTPFSTNTGQVRNNFGRDLRIAGIILRPKELVEFEEQNK